MVDSEELTNLIDGCKNNNPICQSILYKNYRKLILNTVFRFVRDKHTSEDITQEIFIKVFKKIDKYKNNNNFDSWIRKVAVNKSLDYLRKKKYETLSDDLSYIVVYDDSEYKEDEYRLVVINSLIDKLSDHYKDVFKLYYIDELSHKEIAEKLSINIGTSKSNLFKARNKIRKLMSI
jgi:RNA polymerase sigma factor (sigma-70 family)